MKLSQFGSEPQSTGYDIEDLKSIALRSVEVPEEFDVHQRLKKMHIANRIKSIGKNQIDWATAEAMAFIALNQEGYNVRLVGEDVERGTFSQRHLVFHNQSSFGKTYTPLQYNYGRKEREGMGRFGAFNSNLNELGVMGFEYGYSLESPKNLCLWEAQFGDFYNPA
mmetsp:Transcript_7473/g.12631  ORF Transcript_7473/g.12631 Transcript_7473/m.12631 type:complete len:166 (-) Transcript_7473:831-1328(-)